MDQIKPVFASRDKPNLGLFITPNTLVHLVGMAERFSSMTFIIDQTAFLLNAIIHQTNVQTALRHIKLRGHKGQTVRVAIHNRRHFNRVFHRLQANPNACKTRQGPAIQPVIHHLLHTCRANNRHVRVDHREFGLMQHGRGFASVVVPHRHQNAAQCGTAGHIGVTHHIARPVYARTFAVPQAKDAIEFALAAQFSLLRPPMGGGGQILVYTRLKGHIMLGQRF